MVAPELEIVITAGCGEVLRRTVRPGEYVIGSAESADLCLALPEIAGRHALLTVNYDHTLIETLDGSAAVRMQVEDFFDADFEEKSMAAFARAAGETSALKGKAKIVEGEVRIGTACENPGDDLFARLIGAEGSCWQHPRKCRSLFPSEKMEAMKARLFAPLRAHFQRRDRRRLVIGYRRSHAARRRGRARRLFAGRRLVVAAGNSTIYFHDVPPLPQPAPAWLAELAEAVAQRRVDDAGETSRTGTPDVQTLRASFAAAAGEDDYARWVRWFFADRATRTASAFSAVPMSTALDQLTAIGTLSELEEARRRRPTDPKIMTLLAQKYREKSEPAATAHADFLDAFAAWNATTGTAARILEAQKQMRVARVGLGVPPRRTSLPRRVC